MSNLENFQLGERVEDKKTYHRGTVKYLGTVEESQGSWVGIDWDEEIRGKHDGSHNGKKYFQASTDRSGSFVRPGRVTQGFDLESAVRSKYQTPPPDSGPVENMLQQALNARFVQIVGMDKISEKQRDLEKLRIIELKGCQVSHPGECDLSALLPKVRELSLCSNLLNSWETVACIVKQLPTLRSINLSDNKLDLPEVSNLDSSIFDNITHLVMNKMHGYEWQQLISATSFFKNVTKIQMAYNGLEKLGPIRPGVMEKVRDLDIGANPMSEWKELLYLSELKSLEELNVNHCEFQTIEFPVESEEEANHHTTHHLSTLKCLYINRNPLDAWACVCELAKLQRLEQLVLGLDIKADNYFPEFVYAIIRPLKALNRTTLTPAEKKDYNLFYLKKFSREYYLNGGTEDPEQANLTAEFRKKHPTYLSIVRDIGAPFDDSKEVNTSEGRLRDLKIPVMVAGQDGRQTELSLLPSVKISRLKMTVRRALKLPSAAKIQLAYVPANRTSDISISLDSDHREVSYYSIANGDTLHATW